MKTYRVGASTWDAFDLMHMGVISEDEFIERVTRSERRERTKEREWGIAMHSALERLLTGQAELEGPVTGCVPPEDVGEPWTEIFVDRESLDSILEEIPVLATAVSEGRAMPEIKTVARFGALEVPTIADVLAPCWFAVDWKTSPRKKSLDPERWMKSWQWRVTCVAFQLQQFWYCGIQVKEKGGVLFGEPVASCCFERYPGLYGEVCEQAGYITKFLEDRGIETPDIADLYRYGRPD